MPPVPTATSHTHIVGVTSAAATTMLPDDSSDPSADQTSTDTDGSSKGWVAPMIILLVLGCVITCVVLAWHRRNSAESSRQFDGLDPGTTVMVANPLFTRKSRRQKKILPRAPTTTPALAIDEGEVVEGGESAYAEARAAQPPELTAVDHVYSNEAGPAPSAAMRAEVEMGAAAAAPATVWQAPTADAEATVMMAESEAGLVAANKAAPSSQGSPVTRQDTQWEPEPAYTTAPVGFDTYGALDSSQKRYAAGGHHSQNDDSSYTRLGKNTPAYAEMEVTSTSTYGALDPSQQYATVTAGHHPQNDDSSYARLARNDVSATTEGAYEFPDDGPENAVQPTHAGGSGPQRDITAAVKPKLSRQDSTC